MSNFRCKSCDNVVTVANVTRSTPQPCPTPGCTGMIEPKHRIAPSNPYATTSFAHHGVKKTKTYTPIPNRSQGAPPPPNMTNWPIVNLHQSVTYVPSLNGASWLNAAGTTIRLAYMCLDITIPFMQGLIIDYPKANDHAAVRSHFDAITAAMEANITATTATEATGEAAAAMGALTRYAGYTMLWGFHQHAGKGIDQIWWNNNPAHPEYIIVEAKGPGQVLSPNPHMPPGFHQMGKNWVMHNLGMMENSGNADAARILQQLGLQRTVSHPGFGGSSTNYYGVKPSGAGATAKLFGVVFTARWKDDGRLTFSMSNATKYY